MSVRTKAAEWLSERSDFLHIYAAPSTSGSGWDVVMRIDGTYFGNDAKEMAEEVAKALRDDVRWADVPRDRMIWWEGPPHDRE